MILGVGNMAVSQGVVLKGVEVSVATHSIGRKIVDGIAANQRVCGILRRYLGEYSVTYYFV